MRKPIIGVTSNLDNISALSNYSDEFIFVRTNYINAIIRHGGIPVILNSKTPLEDIKTLVSSLDGVLFIGGQDVDTRCYKEESKIKYDSTITDSGTPHLRPLRDAPNYERDLFEIEVYKEAKEAKSPILGICRGYQLINVAEGGTLHQEIPLTSVLHNILPDETIPAHQVTISIDSKLHDIFGTDSITIYSIHHQGIKDLGHNLRITGVAEDGLPEAIEGTLPSHYVVGIQGHPERSCHHFAENNLLFTSFIDACKKHLKDKK